MSTETDAYLEPSQTSTIEVFSAEIVNSIKPSTWLLNTLLREVDKQAKEG